MKHLLLAALALLLMAGCKKNSCVQCSRLVRLAQQTNALYTEDTISYPEFCGQQADSAMSPQYPAIQLLLQ
jgi:hypothetical protein